MIVPDSIASHSREQVVYFGPDGLLRRHDYTVDVMGGAPGSNYAADYRNVDGIVVPTKRRVYAPDANKRKIPEPVLVAIDIRDISFGDGSDNLGGSSLGAATSGVDKSRASAQGKTVQTQSNDGV